MPSIQLSHSLLDDTCRLRLSDACCCFSCQLDIDACPCVVAALRLVQVFHGILPALVRPAVNGDLILHMAGSVLVPCLLPGRLGRAVRPPSSCRSSPSARFSDSSYLSAPRLTPGRRYSRYGSHQSCSHSDPTFHICAYYCQLHTRPSHSSMNNNNSNLQPHSTAAPRTVTAHPCG